MLTIANWDSFEHPTKSKRPDGPCPWFAHPSSLNSKGRLRLLRRGLEGCAALVVFEGICGLHAQWERERRTGELLHSDGTPLDIEDIADAIHMDDAVVATSIEILTSDRIGWLRSMPDPVPVQERSNDGPTPDPKGSLQDRTGQDRNTPQPPKGGGGSAVADQEGKDRDDDPGQGEASDLELALDAWDANRGGKMPPAKRPPDAATFRRWSKLGASPEEVADRARRASASAKWANPDRASPLTFHSLLAAGTWAEVGQLEAPAPKPIENRGRQAMVAAEVAWRSGDNPEALRLAAIAEQYASTEDEARHLRQQIEEPFEAKRPEWAGEEIKA